MMAKALKSLKDAGDFNSAIPEWETRPVALQTYANLKVLMCTEYAKVNRQDSTTAQAMGHASVNNVMEEMAQATEELVVELTKKYAKQIKSVIKTNSEAMEKLTSAILANKQSLGPTNTETKAAKKEKCQEWKKAWEEKKNAPVCPH
jgi:hypothetical protein